MTKYTLYLPKQDNTGKPILLGKYLLRLDKMSPGYTEYDGRGRWSGKSEPVTIIDIVTDRNLRSNLKLFLIQFKTEFNQEACFYTAVPIEGYLI